MDVTEIDQPTLAASKAWPLVEAQKVAQRLADRPDAVALFETGYGPSGLPHIGTFGEVFRTTLVRHAYGRLTGRPTRLVAFSDDMDGLRKIPDNLPEPERLQPFLGRPLTDIPDPFGTHAGFGQHMNARLRQFLDDFGFAYEFMSATEAYQAGRFDATLRLVLERHEAIRAVVLPTLGPERRETYSPILPISPRTGRVLQVPILEARPGDGTVVFADEDGTLTELPVTGGHCKLQWKCDWAMRWAALGVDYEMAGKDLIDSVKLSGQICRLLDGRPPNGFIYELFLDEAGQKISKSKGNGLTIDEWLRYGTRESLALFMYKEPKAAKRLHQDVIARHVDEYQQLLEAFPAQAPRERLGNPVWHLHAGAPPPLRLPVSFGLIQNLVDVLSTDDRAVVQGYLARHVGELDNAQAAKLDQLIGLAIATYRDLSSGSRRRRPPSEVERAALADLGRRLAALAPDTAAADIQTVVYEVGKAHPFASLRDWFKALYEVLLGASEGPRFGSFVAIYGIAAAGVLIERALDAPAPA